MQIKTNIKYLFLIITAIAVGSCTHLDGDIGDWFGSWHLEEMLINGEIDEEYAENQKTDHRQVMVSFQGKIFNMAYIGNREIYGTWNYAGEVLTLVANYNAGSGYEAPDDFDPFPVVLHFPGDVEQVEITVNYINKKTMQWQLIDQNGRLITYNFRKYP